jgi:hypothetical protein
LVPNLVKDLSGSDTRGRESRTHAFSEQREPLDRFVAEDEADVTIRDLVSPATHRRCRHLLLEQTVGDLHAVESERRNVEEK